MKPEDIHAFDPHRLLWGTNVSFAAEVVLRIIVLYGILLVAMRIMGHRLASQLTRNEMLAVVALAAGVGPAVSSPDRGLLPPVIVAVLVVLVQRTLALATLRSPRLESVLQGDGAILVKDGRLELDALRRNAISRDALFANLRGAGLTQLGQVDRTYLEPDGAFTTLRAPPGKPGLSIIPTWDAEFLREQEHAEDKVACESCGTVQEHRVPSCPTCGGTHFSEAVYEAER